MPTLTRRRRFVVFGLITALVAVNVVYQVLTNMHGGVPLTHSFLQKSVPDINHHTQPYDRNETVTVPAIENVNPHNFTLLINPSKVCDVNPLIELVICVPISRNNFKGRRVISETWGSYAYTRENNAILLFFIGKGHADESPEIQNRIQNEAETFHNIVQEDYIDDYANLSIKSVSILKWATMYCYHAKYLLKVDDDIYVNIPNLMTWLRKTIITTTDFITGNVFTGAVPIRDKTSKWYADKSHYPEKLYPAYTSGTAYAMPVTTAERLYLASLRTPLFWLEDIYITGLCAKQAGVKIVNCPMITHTKPKANGCGFKKRITGHRYSLEEIVKIHKELYDPKLKCS